MKVLLSNTQPYAKHDNLKHIHTAKNGERDCVLGKKRANDAFGAGAGSIATIFRGVVI
jgi:hypothetical protein